MAKLTPAETDIKMDELPTRLESLGSSLKSQIMSDLNTWEDRKRIDNANSRRKQTSKRQRTQALPEVPHKTLVELRRLRKMLYKDSSDEDNVYAQVTRWAVGVLSVFVSVADMKGNCKLDDLTTLPGAKAVFSILVLAVECSFTKLGEERGELALVDTVVDSTKDPRAICWILKQYGALHKRTFPLCLHLYAITHAATNVAVDPSGTLGAFTGIVQAINEFALAFPTENYCALSRILEMYFDALKAAHARLQGSYYDPSANSDRYRFVLCYLLQPRDTHAQNLSDHTESTSQRPILLDPEARTHMQLVTPQWLSYVVWLEIQTRFSLFPHPRPPQQHVPSSIAASLALSTSGDSQIMFLALEESMDSLFSNDKKTKKATSVHHIDVAWVLSAIEFVDAIARAEPSDAQIDNTRFVVAFHKKLAQTLRREQELVVLHAMPKAVKSMPQPIPNGLLELAQRGGRTVTKAPLNNPKLQIEEVERLTVQLGRLLRSCDATNECVDSMVFAVVPALVEVIVSRIDSAPAVKALACMAVESWPVGQCDADSAVRGIDALLRTLLAIDEGSHGQVAAYLFGLTESAAKDRPADAAVRRTACWVRVLGVAVEHRRVTAHRLVHSTYSGIVDSLCAALAVNWRPIWGLCFKPAAALSKTSAKQKPAADAPQDDEDFSGVLVAQSSMRIRLVAALDTLVSIGGITRTIDRTQLVLMAIAEYAKIHYHGPEDLQLARRLLSLIVALASVDRGIERLALEQILDELLSPDAAHTPATYTQSMVGIRALEDVLNGTAPDADTGGARLSLLFQNAVRPAPKYPRASVTHNHDKTLDSWTLAARNTRDHDTRGVRMPLVVVALRAVAHASATGTTVLARLLEEYYAESLPTLAPLAMDARLVSVKLQLTPVELELLTDSRANYGLEYVISSMMREGSAKDAEGSEVARDAVRPLASALVVALVVFWNGALNEPVVKREADLAFTTRLVANVVCAYGCGGYNGVGHICGLLPVLGGADLSRVLYYCVWRCALHGLPDAADDARRLVAHLLRKYIASAAPLVKYFRT